MRVKPRTLLLVAASAVLLASQAMAIPADPVLVGTMEPTHCFLPTGQAPGGSHSPHGIAAVGSSLIAVNRAWQGEFYEYTFDDGCPFVRSFDPPGICPGDPAFDGSSLWYTDCFDDVVYRVDLDGDLIESLSSDVLSDASITWDSTSLWAVERGQPATVYKLDTSLQVEASFTVDTYLMSLAWDGDTLWAGDLWGTIYRLTTDGTICGEWPGLAGARISGMTFDDEGFLYAIDVISDLVYKFDVSFVPPCDECPDNDGDGYQDELCGGMDCDDFDPGVNPGADESLDAGNCDDGVDNDCDGLVDVDDPDCACWDEDEDGYDDVVCGGDDCDDSNPFVYPSADEVCDNGIDDDCDGQIDECVDIGPYINLSDGRTLEYIHMIDEGSGFVAEEMYVNVMGIHSEGVMAEAEFAPPDYTPSALHLYQSNGDGYYILGDFDLIGGELSFIYNPAIGPVDGAMEVDVTEVHDYAVMYSPEVYDGPFRLERTLLMTDVSTTTPAGSFDDCVLIQELYYDEELVLRDTVLTMLAYGVGPVYRMTNDVDLHVLAHIY